MIETKKRSTWKTLALIAAFVFLSLGSKHVTARAGQAYYVATDGNDSNSGAQDKPWKTIQKAADSAQPGDTVYVRGGTYTGTVRFTHSGKEGSPITFQNYQGESVTIKATDWAGLHLNADWLVIDGFKETGASSHGIFITGANHNVVQNSEFTGNGWAGVMFGGDRGPASDNIVRNCNVHDNKQEGIYLRTGPEGKPGVQVNNNVIEGNHVHNNGAEGIQNTETFEPPYPNGTVIRGNQVHDNGGDWGGGMDLGGENLVVENNVIYSNRGRVGGVWFSSVKNGVIRNNIVVDSKGSDSNNAAGIHVKESSGVQVYNNTVYGNNGYGVYMDNTQGSAKNNIVSQNGNQLRLSGSSSAGYNLIDGKSDSQGDNAIQAGPQFVNTKTGDWRLQASSPAVNAGIDAGARQDINGVARSEGSACDLGAYQSNPGAPAK